ncbi:MAG: sirohydrochlorin cobaltochelatase [Thermodesulfobacteriota bacterium]
MKFKCFKIVLIFIVLMLLAASSGPAADSKESENPEKGILLVTFGTTFDEARSAFDNIEENVREAFPDTPVKWAYTSEIIREKMEKQGNRVNSPMQALKEMDEQGFSSVAVQSLHTTAGFEYHDLVKTVRKFEDEANSIKDINIGGPLLNGPEDMEKAAEAIRGFIPDERKSDEAVVLLGHGTHHPANSAYAALMWRLQTEDENIYIGTVEGYPGSETIVEQLKERQISSAWLLPFMSVAGDHAKNDMAGPGEDSWKTLFSDAGIRAKPVLKGFAEHDAFVDIWVEHLEKAM